METTRVSSRLSLIDNGRSRRSNTIMKFGNYIFFGFLTSILFAAGCGYWSDRTQVDVNVNADVNQQANRRPAEPTISAAPVSDGDEGYKLVTGDSFRLTVQAPGASEVELFYQPVTAGDRALQLQTLSEQTSANVFAVDLNIPEDFNGQIWGRAKYSNGEAKETKPLLLAKRVELETESGNPQPSPTPSASSATSDPEKVAESTDSDESARSDLITGGGVRRGALRPGDGDIRITVNVPAFKMTLWQGGREIKSNYVGVGLKDFPIPVGMRSADKIILNPDWIPPDSAWVRRSSSVEPYERISADDPNNPLGKIKIPLGQAYLLHEAQGPSDIGNLVSHGCVRVMRDDLFEVSKMIARARNLSTSGSQIDAARRDTERRVLNLNGDVQVDINYDTMVVENGVLTIYPDVYDKNMNTIENLKAELARFNVDSSRFDDAVLKQMLDKVNSDQKYVVAISELLKGSALDGKVEPLTPQQAKEGNKPEA